jgi:hypothetical protein
MTKFKKGGKVNIVLSGAGSVTREEGSVLKITKKGVWLDNGAGNDPSGPFDPTTGSDLSDCWVPGFSRHIEAKP